LSEQIQLITSPDVVRKAVQNFKLASLGCFQKKRLSEDGLVKDIIDHLVATCNPSSKVLSLTFRGTAPEDCDAVVKAIVASYQDSVKETHEAKLLRQLPSESVISKSPLAMRAAYVAEKVREKVRRFKASLR
jgi:hypothetical protein